MSTVTGSNRVVGWGTMLRAGWSRVRFPMRSLDIFSLFNPSSRTMALGSAQPLTEMSTRNLPGGKGRPENKANNLTAICEPIVWRKRGNLDVSQPYGASKTCYRCCELLSELQFCDEEQIARPITAHCCVYFLHPEANMRFPTNVT
jgi:hypothetical protein